MWINTRSNRRSTKNPDSSQPQPMPPSTSTSCSDSPRRGRRQSLHGRLGMRKWLENLLDNSTCHGLQWKDESEKIFSIVWRHASSHGFDQSKHADVFLQWHRYRGRTEKLPGKRKHGNYNSTLKSNFRCALRSLIDCIEIKSDENIKRTFQFIDESNPLFKVRRDKKRGSYNKKTMKKPLRGISLDDANVKQEDPESETTTDDHVEETEQQGNTSLSDAATVKREKMGQEVSPEELGPHQGQGSQTQTLPSCTIEIGPNGYPSVTLFQNAVIKKSEINEEKPSEPASTSLPDFKALGVKDQYGPANYTNSKHFTSGGMVSVKRMDVEKTNFTEAIEVPLLQPQPIITEGPSVNQIQVEGTTIDLIDNGSFQNCDEIIMSNDEQFIQLGTLEYFPSTGNITDAGMITQSTNILNNLIVMQDEFPFNFQVDESPDRKAFAMEKVHRQEDDEMDTMDQRNNSFNYFEGLLFTP